ncbi:hypothetical protein WN944_022148 [Citrus x changshan-huyou]|uniref:Uncharacterized protein n=1 Tax=Citrus x changshan-huyou TaxID=2935761 RepID=A0AAP0N463_9ROSI|nr:uncharacterized protein LOC102629894 [Citrus sinensis]
MEGKGITGLRLLITSMVVLFLLLLPAAAEGHGQHHIKLDTCLANCYPKCNVPRPLWCATLCIGKCKNLKSIPDNLCNCTYTCSKFKCAEIGSDPEAVKKCVKGCSKLCNMKI